MLTDDGIPIDAAYETAGGAEGDLVFVVAHGFTGALERPALRRAALALSQRAPVITFSFRGHGRSGGRSTVGDREVLDLAAAVRWARRLGHRRVVTVGFSMGGSVVLRHAARPGTSVGTPAGDATAGSPATGTTGEIQPYATGGGEGRTQEREGRGGRRDAHADAVIAVSAPARWFYRGTAPMRRLHWAVTHPAGRLVSRYGLRTRVAPHRWNPVPLSPVASVPLIAPTPLLIVHGDADPYFPLDHPRMLAQAADPSSTELWIERGFGHAENSAGEDLLTRIAAWAATHA
ncbi:alpha/beta hydrolase [Streptomyces sp. XD-27]|uniref:alpha/beta hydrolase n=1 Tax=Streptomyces sp. XD-27 TaxID=3062779 RepID=UPI0026F41954|nr:alpha/beta hydrolase [Streptomyces sp. XD-27]WKX74292.1 alpha/beta hydrolase [Streptomyces sp. XD-27]